MRLAAGSYLSQPLTLCSQTPLWLVAGAKMPASTNPVDFMVTPGDWTQAASASNFIPLIAGQDLTDVTIAGAGTIDGAGGVWWAAAETVRRKVPATPCRVPTLSC